MGGRERGGERERKEGRKGVTERGGGVEEGKETHRERGGDEGKETHTERGGGDEGKESERERGGGGVDEGKETERGGGRKEREMVNVTSVTYRREAEINICHCVSGGRRKARSQRVGVQVWAMARAADGRQ